MIQILFARFSHDRVLCARRRRQLPVAPSSYITSNEENERPGLPTASGKVWCGPWAARGPSMTPWIRISVGLSLSHITLCERGGLIDRLFSSTSCWARGKGLNDSRVT
ncbi:hypothetical protein EVAR_98380_1 [Eumeta japonica]|uniref:Uncharacterized protein n=1 Tax=Eumeta variegata TaxID=151549 RepID=A0A4C1XU03_EUMVA|nr:hypothetical protein EVAR_98380_1 [Eumeta japonica]